jgi:hypothetical protein
VIELDQRASPATVDLTAVIVAMIDGEPCILTVQSGPGEPDTLPCGPLQPDHRTLQAGLRSWVEYQTGLRLGYMEQLYTFADRNRAGGDDGPPEQDVRPVSVAYLALVHDADPQTGRATAWQPWYDYLPWEDWRTQRPPVVDRLLAALADWRDQAPSAPKRRRRAERLRLTFANGSTPWDEERSLERYELLYGARLVAEAWHDEGAEPPESVATRVDQSMATDHRRILATAMGRLRGKIKYRPLLFELMPPTFTLLQLQRTAEALSGTRLHKQNFRRLVERQQLVEATGQHETRTGGRPARLMRFRPAVTLERPAPGVGIKTGARSTHRY